MDRARAAEVLEGMKRLYSHIRKNDSEWEAIDIAIDTLKSGHTYVVCPVCGGRGIVPNYFYSFPKYGVYYEDSSAVDTITVCRTCGGSGII